MKQTRRLTFGLVACAVAFGMISNLSAQTATEGSAKVIRMKGLARYSTGNNVWQPVKVGTVLGSGTVVQTSTEQGSFVDLAVGDGTAPVASSANYKPSIPNSLTLGSSFGPSADQNVIRIWENTALGIDKVSIAQTGADEVTDTQLDLKAGRLTGAVKKLSAASKFEIKLPNGVAGVRGTVFDVNANGVVRVLIGSMVLAWVDPKSGNVTTQVVMGGQQYAAGTGTISAISATDIKSFDSLAASMRGTGALVITPATYISDKTVTFVSPVGPGEGGDTGAAAN